MRGRTGRGERSDAHPPRARNSVSRQVAIESLTAGDMVWEKNAHGPDFPYRWAAKLDEARLG
ncbi:hypothetical protein BV25DRAFT_1826619 [Artomyces pyxidatus]|uniref:Uncharacterized protein n=1 Tax=Artomyces pyxidatus TaxID=48021 RepID=A0ACB8T099_9AGAM|nr:hypothetical protein BV25DRAFT_1826619 [Artomyces pyxidatus]